MTNILISDTFYILLLVGLSIPLGIYIYKVMTGQRVFLTRLLSPVERGMYRMMGVRGDTEMTPKSYTGSVLALSGISLLFVFLLQVLQNVLPLNPEHMKPVSWDLALNTAISFVTNTNWQAYSGESTLSYLTQSLGLTVQNFLSAAVGIAVLFALIRGFVQKKQATIGNFWKDLVRVTLYVLIPLSLDPRTWSLFLRASCKHSVPYAQTTALESGAAQTIPLGPAASQIAIKQLGTNGGGFFRGEFRVFRSKIPTLSPTYCSFYRYCSSPPRCASPSVRRSRIISRGGRFMRRCSFCLCSALSA